MSIRVHRKAFRAIKLLAYPRGLFHCQEYIQFFDTNCGLFMRLHFTIIRVGGAGRNQVSENEKNAVLFSPLAFGYFWPTSTLLHGHIALAIPSVLETDPQILEHCGYDDEHHSGK